jgi:molecular chaperone HtpG
MEHRFQVDLRGIIEILSEHLYSGPEVFVRELLQNAVDAITARQKLNIPFEPRVRLELTKDADGVALLTFSDNGVGLLEDEVHQFLATIGKSSKRLVGQRGTGTSDFIGQFGIGLLSCFVVSDEIVLLSRSAKDASKVVEFRGRPEGSYGVRAADPAALEGVGSRVTLRAKTGFERFFEPDELERLVLHYGALLPFPIELSTAGLGSSVVNRDGAVWRREFASPAERHAALMDFGAGVLGREPFDVIDLNTEAGAVDGVALVLPWTPNLAAKPKHVVYLKNMLLDDEAEGLAPDWAFFVRLVVNTNALKPTASREGFSEDATLEAARHEIGEALQAYLGKLADAEPDRFKALVRLHDLSIKALALENDALFTLFAPRLEFESSSGPMTLAEYRHSLNPVQGGAIYYTRSLEQFRQMARVAGAQGFNVLNGGYVYAAELLERYAQLNPDIVVERVEADFFASRFEELSITERNGSFDFLRLLEDTLEPFGCGVELLHFKPRELPTLFVTSAQQRFLRSIESAQEVANDLFGGVLENLKTAQSPKRSYSGQLYVNFSNPLVRRLASLGRSSAAKSVTEVLYVQSLLLAQHPLSSLELQTLTNGLGKLIELGLHAGEVSRATN